MYKNTAAIFKYLKPLAAKCETVIYSQVQFDVGGHKQSMGKYELSEIQRICDDRSWPHLNALVVAKKNNLPGDAYKPCGHSVIKIEFEKIKQEVCEFDWTDKHL